MIEALRVAIPSRGRPNSVRVLNDTLRATSGPDTVWTFGLDNDDETHGALVTEMVPCTVGPRLRMAGTLNALTMEAVAQGVPFVGFLGDDHRPEHRWDDSIIETLVKQPLAIVYGNDLFQCANLPTAVFMDAMIPKTLGYICPPGFQHLYLDNVWKAWGEALGTLTYLPDVIIEHLHPAAGKAEWDDRYVEVNSGGQYESDRAAFDAYMADDFDRDVAKLRALL